MQNNVALLPADENKAFLKDELASTDTRPLKSWEIDRYFRCPLVGVCLTLAEQKQLMKKAGISSKKKSPFEIHETLVSCMDSENRLSRKIDVLLHRKYFNETTYLFEMDEKSFMVHWRSRFNSGVFDADFWAATARPDLSPESRREIFGTVHMAMHSNAEQLLKLEKKLSQQREENNMIKQKLRDETRAKRAIQKENVKMVKNRQELENDLLASRKEIGRLEDELAHAGDQRIVTTLELENECIRTDVTILADKNNRYKKQVAALGGECRRLSTELKQLKASYAHFKTESQKIIEGFLELGRCDATCPSFDLCRKRVLIVGGITKMESLYRRLIEGSGGIFEYHDGYVKGGTKALESRLRRADVVLCPVSCNSHAACSVVKNLGKKHNIPVHMLHNSSLNAVTRVLHKDN